MGATYTELPFFHSAFEVRYYICPSDEFFSKLMLMTSTIWINTYCIFKLTFKKALPAFSFNPKALDLNLWWCNTFPIVLEMRIQRNIMLSRHCFGSTVKVKYHLSQKLSLILLQKLFPYGQNILLIVDLVIIYLFLQ